MTDEQEKEFTGTVEELPYPSTLANDANGYEMIRGPEQKHRNPRRHSR